ncbi:homoserine dehydrogenase [Thermotalea metallivorans]|uniref:Homoserine dehydrogenase n=1 Tax=Thermotalea metallivorans TaxID=520762 RepID=A0A140LB50_9FIRM|nr:homoserine dehydrogenase [Thermotalea metallivorans]KXG77775.1 Homoserine dehydrogenase [Thermotalea metallivorans]
MKRVRIVLAGYGNVGYRFAEIMKDKYKAVSQNYGLELQLVAVIGRRYAVYEDRGISLDKLLDCGKHGKGLAGYGEGAYPIESSLDILKNIRAHVLVEATPTNIETGEPGYSHMRQAFRSGMDVVALSKGALVCHYREIMEEMQKHHRRIKVSGATAAALPTIDMGQYNLAGNDIYRIQGIFNGTTNYILTRMHKEGIPYHAALKEAQEKGIAEADPRLDVGGFDTASKLLILVNSLMNTAYTLKDIEIQGIEKIDGKDIMEARQKDRTIKLVGEAFRTEDGIKMQVRPMELENSNLLSKADYKDKAVVFYTDLMGTISVIGGGSDPKAAAAAAFKDIINLYK